MYLKYFKLFRVFAVIALISLGLNIGIGVAFGFTDVLYIGIGSSLFAFFNSIINIRLLQSKIK